MVDLHDGLADKVHVGGSAGACSCYKAMKRLIRNCTVLDSLALVNIGDSKTYDSLLLGIAGYP